MSTTLLSEARAALPEGNTTVSADLSMKQLVHTQVLLAMDDTGLLDATTFQGGSSITNCYGGIRLSEDLDFTVDEFPSEEASAELAQRIKERLGNRFGTESTVKLPKRTRDAGGDTHVPVRQFRVKIPYVDNRPDIPWLYVKVELAQVARETSRPVEIAPPISFEGDGLNPIVLAEEPVEIIADKVISFSGTTTWIRIRDLFDINWLMTHEHIDIDQLRELVTTKLAQYGLERTALTTHTKELRNKLYGTAESVAAMDSMRGMLIDVDYAKRLASPRGSMAVIGKALDAINIGLSEKASAR